jgi:predicted DNA-binding protein with PD1-like motif
MDVYGKIGSKMREINGAHLMSSNVFTAEVTEITGQTCSVKVDEMPLTEVRLRAVINTRNEQIFIKPKIGSHVLVMDLSRGNMRDLAVVSYSEIDEVNIKIGTQSLVMNKDGIVVNGGTLGVVKIRELTDKLNELVQKFNVHTHTVSTTGTATAQTGTAAPTTGTAIAFDKSHYEDTKIKH